MLDSSRHIHPAAGPGPQTVVVTLPTEIDLANSGQVRDALTRALCNGATTLIADATRTTFLSCAGLGALTSAHHQAAAAGAQLRMAASPAVRRILELTGTEHLFQTYPTVAAALDSEQPPTGSNGSHPFLRSASGSTAITQLHSTQLPRPAQEPDGDHQDRPAPKSRHRPGTGPPTSNRRLG